jgi:hypothetical protein
MNEINPPFITVTCVTFFSCALAGLITWLIWRDIGITVVVFIASYVIVTIILSALINPRGWWDD